MRRKLFMCKDLRGKEQSVWMEPGEFFASLDDRGRIKVGRKVLVWDGTESARSGGCAAWPMESEAAAVHPRQAREAYEHSVRSGVPTEFNPRTGAAIFRDRTHRRNYLRAYGMHDRDAGYGD